MNSSVSSAPDLPVLLSEIDREIARELHKQQSQLPEFGAGAESLEEIGRHICFMLADRHLAVPLPLVLEVGELEVVRPLPFLPEWVDGVTNIRGEIVSVTSLALFFHLARQDRKKSRSFIIIHDQGMKTAITVDRITGTRLLYRREGMVLRENRAQSGQTVPAAFLSGQALFFADNTEQELELFDGKRLLSSITL